MPKANRPYVIIAQYPTIKGLGTFTLYGQISYTAYLSYNTPGLSYTGNLYLPYCTMLFIRREGYL